MSMYEMKDFVIRNRFSPRNPVTLDCRVPVRGKDGKTTLEFRTRTKQSARDECDINFIMKRFQKTGILPSTDRQAMYGDFSDVKDFRESLEIVHFAQEQFASLPSAVRKRFGNDPAAFLEFVHDPKNGEEMVKLGLATKRSIEAPSKPQEGPPGGEKDAPKPSVSGRKASSGKAGGDPAGGADQ